MAKNEQPKTAQQDRLALAKAIIQQSKGKDGKINEQYFEIELLKAIGVCERIGTVAVLRAIIEGWNQTNASNPASVVRFATFLRDLATQYGMTGEQPKPSSGVKLK